LAVTCTKLIALYDHIFPSDSTVAADDKMFGNLHFGSVIRNAVTGRNRTRVFRMFCTFGAEWHDLNESEINGS
jgi:hypothetical protein